MVKITPDSNDLLYNVRFSNKVCILQSVNLLTRFIDYRSYYEVLPHKCIEVILIGEEI